MKKEVILKKPGLNRGQKKPKEKRALSPDLIDTPNEAWDWIEDEDKIILLRQDKGIALAVVTRDLPAIEPGQETQVWVSWEFSPEDKAWAVKRVFPDYSLEPLLINPHAPDDPRGIIEAIVEAVLDQVGFGKGGTNEPPRKPDRNHQGRPAKPGPGQGRFLPDHHGCE